MKRPDNGQRVILIRNGKVCPLMPVYSRRTEYMGRFIKPLIMETWEFPTDSEHHVTTRYSDEHDLYPFIREGDHWLPIPEGDV